MTTANCCYLCNECASSFASLAELEHHMSSAHTEDTVIAVATIDEKAPLANGIDEPNSEIGDDIDDEDELGERDEDDDDEPEEHSPSSSDISSFDADHHNTLLSGLGAFESPDGGKSFPCRFCPKVFAGRSQLNIHYTHTHRDKPQYECEVCKTVFSVKRELSTHMRIHSGEQPHRCTQCGKEFGTRQLLKKHWMWHTGERSHVCPHCGKAFFQKGHLTQHLMIHAGGRPHQCSLCQKTFIFKFDLNRHMKIHAERGYSCEKCGRAFLKPSSLEEHLAKCRTSTVLAAPTTGAGKSRTSPSGNAKRTTSSTPLSDIVKRERFSPSVIVQQSETNVNTAASTPTPVHHIGDESSTTLSPAIVNALVNHQHQLQQQQQHQQAVQQLVQQQQQQQQQFFCFFCMKQFGSQAAYTLHLSFVHFRNGILNTAAAGIGQHENGDDRRLSNAQQQQQLLLSTSIFGTQVSAIKSTADSSSNHIKHAGKNAGSDSSSSLTVFADSATESDGSSPNKHQQQQCDQSSNCSRSSAVSSNGSSSNKLVIGCDACDTMRKRVGELERAMLARDADLIRLKETMRRVGAISGTLLESCTDFDKLWMLHSKKVYTQIQSVLCSIE